MLLLLCCLNSFSQNLDELLQEVVSKNPELSALNSQFLAAQERIQQESQLSNPTIGLGVPILRPETRLGPQIVMVSASQMFPWFGTFKAKENVMIEMSEAKYQAIALLKLDLFYQLKEAYYTLHFNLEKINVLRENLSLYVALEQISLSKVTSGTTTTADVYRAQLKQQKIAQDIREVEFENKQLSAIINQLIKAPLDNQIIPSENANEITTFNYDTTAFRNNLQNHPKIAMLTHEALASESRQVLSQKMNTPNFGVGIDYSLVGARTDANPLNNGRDIFIPKVMLTIPLYQKRNNTVQKEESFIQESIVFQQEAIEDIIMRQLSNLKTDYDTYLSQITFCQKQIETTNLAIEVLLSKYSSSGTSFDEILQLYTELLKHQIHILNAKLQTKLTVAKVEKLTAY